MDDSPELIRQQMEETRSQLSEKLESLELQVSETVQSTGEAVSATVGAVQETAEMVQGAVQSVSHAFDLRHQIDRHPWIILGGSFVLGCLAAEMLTGPAKKSESTRSPDAPPCPPENNAGHGNGEPVIDTAATVSAIAAAYESGLKDSSWHQLRNAAGVALIRIVQDVASRAVPQAVDYLTGNRSGTSEMTGEPRGSPGRYESSEAAHRLHIASSEYVRAGNSS